MRLLLLALMALAWPAAARASETPAMDDLTGMSEGAAQAGLILDGAKAQEKNIPTDVAGPAVGESYRLERLLSPHKPFTRPPAVIDVRALRVQAAKMTEEIRSSYLVDDGKLFLYMKPMSLGDMNIWQGVYAAMAVLQYNGDPSPENQEYAEKAFDGLAMMYQSGLPMLRGVLPDGVQNSDQKDPHYRHEGGYQKLEDASVDSASGWVFGMMLAAQRLPSRRARAQDLLRRFAGDLIANGYSLTNSGGARTHFGDMGRSRFVSSPPGILLSMAALSEASQNSADPRFRSELDRLTDSRTDRWAAYIAMPGFWRNTSTNQNIGMLGVSSALLAEQDPDRWLTYAHGMLRMMGSIEQTGNSFWLYLSYWTLDRRPDMVFRWKGDRVLGDWLAQRAQVMSLAKKSLREFSTPKCFELTPQQVAICREQKQVRWLGIGKKTYPQPLPMFCRANDFDWQRTAYEPNSCGAGRQFTNMDFLIAYALAREDGGVRPDE